jgi:thiamine biosynthesis lipoprotein
MMTHPQSDISFIGSSWDFIPDAHCFSHNAMATVFEVIIIHKDARYAEQAAWAAFGELDKIEQQLSRFIENSDISRINNLTVNQPLQLGLEAFECLQLCVSLGDLTDGAFDITVGALKDSRFNKNIIMQTGLHLIKLNEEEHTVQLPTSGVQIDLGGIGKGYAIDQMAKLLSDWSIDTALINGGCSSVMALGRPHNTEGWHLTLSNPTNRRQTLADLYLQNRAVSGSGLLKGVHIIAPATTQPVKDKRAAWAYASTAATADALSTAFMVMSPDQIKKYCSSHPDILAMIVCEDYTGETGKDRILRYGLWKQEALLKK